MNPLDIITIVAFALAVLVCVWKGFLKILLKFGAFVVSAIVAKFFGSAIGDMWFSDLIDVSSGGMTASVLDKVNESISTVIGTVVVFVIFYIVLRIIFSLVAKLVKKAPGVTTVDRILGAVFGLVMAFGFMFVFSEIVRIYATVVTYFDAGSALFETIENTLIFKYFF